MGSQLDISHASRLYRTNPESKGRRRLKTATKSHPDGYTCRIVLGALLSRSCFVYLIPGNLRRALTNDSNDSRSHAA